MTSRAPSFALVVALTALPALAQEAPGGGDEPFDIFSPAALGSSGNDAGAASGSGGAVLDAGKGSAPPAVGQGKPIGQGKPTGNDADILAADPTSTKEMEWAFAQERVEAPPPEVAAEIKERVQREVAEPAQRYGKELEQLNLRAQTDPKGAQQEAVRLADQSDASFPDLSATPVTDGAAGEVEDVARGVVGSDGRPAATTATGTTGATGSRSTSPWDAYTSSGYSDPSGLYASNGYTPISRPAEGTPESRMSWWQKLLLSAIEGAAEGVKGLAERRANELRARSEKIRREYPNYRAWVDVETRRAIERSAFARAGSSSPTYDRRLEGLILGPAGSGSSSSSTASTSTGRVDLSTAGAGADLRSNSTRPVARLPRVRDPVTGEERIVIDMPLGVDAVRPLR